MDKKNTKNHLLFGRIHLAGMVLQSIYGYFPSTIDPIYLIHSFCLPMSWIFCKDECILSYIMKKRENPNYILGSEPENVKDIIELFPENPIYYRIFYHSNHMVRMISLVIVNERSVHIPNAIFYTNLCFYSLYVYNWWNVRENIYFRILFSYLLIRILSIQLNSFLLS
jgi:hypothetical protein